MKPQKSPFGMTKSRILWTVWSKPQENEINRGCRNLMQRWVKEGGGGAAAAAAGRGFGRKINASAVSRQAALVRNH
jgi:hypothetical protein